MAAIEIKELSYYYPDAPKPALEHINLSISEGEFVVLVGGSGSGKSSLVKAMAGLIPDFYGGKISGTVYLSGQTLRDMKRADIVQKVGLVFQDPEAQLVMTNVLQELVFGLENLGLPPELMKRRVMEVASALSLHPFLNHSIHELSGGLKQKVVLASILAMQPEILILDEPTSQLDPVAGEEILTLIRRLNEDNGMTVVLIEQRLERCFHLADRILVLKEGHLVHNSTNREDLVRQAVEEGSPFIPPLAKLFAGAGFKRIPMTVKEGRKVLGQTFGEYNLQEVGASRMAQSKLQITPNSDKSVLIHRQATSRTSGASPLLEIEGLWFSYATGTEVLKNIDLQVYPGEFLAIMGENAGGKTTLLKNIRGLLKPTRGEIKLGGQALGIQSVQDLAAQVGYLAQNPNDYLFQATVREEIGFTLQNLGLQETNRCEVLLEELALTQVTLANPRDLSTGERQRVALASILAADPPLILLDEPTRGMDYEMKARLGELLGRLHKAGHTLILVTHDVEFAAEYAEELLFMSQGQIVAKGHKSELLSRSTFYSSQVSKLFAHAADGIVTLEEGAKALQRLVDSKEKGGKSYV